MLFRISGDNPVLLREKPLPDAPTPAGTIDIEDLLEQIADPGNGWREVKVITRGAEERHGFVRLDLLTEVMPPAAEEIDEKALLRQIADAAARYGANQDYLFAVAVAARSLQNNASGGPSAVGPFRFIPEIWNDLVEKNGAETDITVADISDSGSQAVFAAIEYLDALTAFGKSTGPAPSDSQLYCSHLLGIEAAASILSGDLQIPVVTALRGFYNGTPLGAGFVEKLVNLNSGLLTGKTVAQVLDAVADPLAAGRSKAASLAAELGLAQQMPDARAGGNDLKAAFRASLRLNEIGSDSPYKLFFAGKGASGASFGFMQGDLATGGPDVRTAFQGALAASNVPEAKIFGVVQRLSVHLIENPLDEADTKLVNDALNASAGRAHVDLMDEQIFANKCRDLDKCVAVAAAAGKTIDPKAQIYMILWTNMTGVPTVLLDWLSGKDVTMAKFVRAPGAIVDGNAMEDFLRATSFFSENPGNFPHMTDSAAAGLHLLEAAPSTGAVRFSANRGIDLQQTESIKQLAAVVGEASKALPDGFRVTVTSALRRGATVAGTGGRSQHADGNAIDIAIIDPNGRAVPNRGTDDTHLYQLLAIAAFHANERMFPGRSGQLAWGGNFTTGPADGPRDLMHFDYGGDRGRFGRLAQEASAGRTQSA